MRVFVRLQRMHDQDAIHAGVGQRRHRRLHQRRGGAPVGWPMDDTLRGRHEGEDPLRLLAKTVEVRRRIAKAEHAQPGVILPARAHQPRHQAARDLPQRRVVKGPQIDDVEHGLDHRLNRSVAQGAPVAAHSVVAFFGLAKRYGRQPPKETTPHGFGSRAVHLPQ